MKEEWLFPAALIPVDRETTHALVVEIKRLIDVVGGMALAQSPQSSMAWQEGCEVGRLAEREACAKICDHMASRCNDIRAAALESAAENIRARGNT